MAYDDALAERVRAALPDAARVREVAMFGSRCFMVEGNLAVGVMGDELLVRVGRDAHDDTVTEPGVRTADMRGRPMHGWVLVARTAVASDAGLAAWVGRGAAFARSLPPKA
jgi:hypothetical protein